MTQVSVKEKGDNILEKVSFHSDPKESNAKECSNYCTVALISHASKLMLKFLQASLQQYVNRELPDVQAGFRKGRETRDHIAKHSLGHRKSKRVPEKHLLLLSRFSRVQLCATP